MYSSLTPKMENIENKPPAKHPIPFENVETLLNNPCIATLSDVEICFVFASAYCVERSTRLAVSKTLFILFAIHTVISSRFFSFCSLNDLYSPSIPFSTICLYDETFSLSSCVNLS